MKTRLLIIIGIITIVTICSLSLTYSQEILIGLGMLEIDPAPTLENNFTLTVSNQSFDIDPIDILVKIDGKIVIDGKFLVKFQHNYQTFEFDLKSGTHTIYAESIKGNYQLKEEFTIERELWASLDFQYSKGDETLPKLRLTISEIELGFL